MKPENLAKFSDEQLVQEYKKLKTNKKNHAFIVGITIGIFFYSTVKNGFGLFTFFPLIIGYLLIKNETDSKLIENEIRREMTARNLK